MSTLFRGACATALAMAMALAAGVFPRAAGAAPIWGLHLGLSEARLLGADVGNVGNSYNAGFALGVAVEFPIGSAFTLQPELMWIRKGGQSDPQFGGTPGHFELAIDYLELPVLVRWSLPMGGAFQPYAIAGPAVAYRLNDAAKLTLDYARPYAMAAPRLGYAAIFEQVGTLGSPNLSDWDFSAVSGVGAVVGNGTARLVLEARYAYGFVDVFRLGADTHNGVLLAMVGIELH